MRDERENNEVRMQEHKEEEGCVAKGEGGNHAEVRICAGVGYIAW